MIKELIKKIELQSILVLFISLSFGYFLLRIENNFSSPAGILGSLCIGLGLIYTLGSFFSNQLKENHKDLIAGYKETIATLKSTHKHIQKSYSESLSGQSKIEITSGYTTNQGNSGTLAE